MNDLEAALCEAQIAAGLRTDVGRPPAARPSTPSGRPPAPRRCPAPDREPARRWLMPASPPRARSSSASPLTVALIGPASRPTQARGEVDRIAEEALPPPP
jgi:hypothetical protein